MRAAPLFGLLPPFACAWLAVQADPVLEPALPPIHVDCAMGGPVTPAVDYILANVTITDRLARVGGINGRSVPRERIEQAADEYARAQPAPAVVLAMLAQCLPDAKVRYPVGYEIIARALYRETQRRPTP